VEEDSFALLEWLRSDDAIFARTSPIFSSSESFVRISFECRKSKITFPLLPSTMPSSSGLTNALTVLTACSLTAAVTFYLTAAAAERKVLAEKKRKYDRDLALKEKTIAARKLSGEPQGEIIDDVTLDRVYLWNIEDLKSRFNPCNIENVMRNTASTTTNPYYFPSMKKSASNDSIAELSDGKTTPYNKLITNHECVLGEVVRKPNQQPFTHAYVRAGPRRLLHFDPAKVNAAIVTCGGLCPGLNNVIREIVNTLYQTYGIGGKVFGIQGGYNGFHDFDHYRPVELTPELVANIHHEGGTVLGSSRGGFDLDKILNFLKSNKVSCLFVIGGDGTHRGAFRKLLLPGFRGGTTNVTLVDYQGLIISLPLCSAHHEL
jgi:Phosphofructokinase